MDREKLLDFLYKVYQKGWYAGYDSAILRRAVNKKEKCLLDFGNVYEKLEQEFEELKVR